MLSPFTAGSPLYVSFPMVSSASPEWFASGLEVTLEAWSKTGSGAWVVVASPGTPAEIGTSGVYEITIAGSKTNVDQLLLKVTADGAADSAMIFQNAAQLSRIESQTTKLSGAPVTVNGNVKPGGQIILKHGDDHLDSQGNALSVGVSDVGGSLFTLMDAVGVENLSIFAMIGKDTTSRIEGTVAALNYASDVLTVTIEFAATETAKGRVGPVYEYDVVRTGTPTRTYFSGKLTVSPDAR
ncbi:MAG: hypothetical protein R3C20_12630 [Planctomycetaceae bacterium]